MSLCQCRTAEGHLFFYTQSVFLIAARREMVCRISGEKSIFLCAYFISSRVAKYFAFRVVQPGDRPIAIILAIQIFTVVSQVALASILGVYHGYGFTSQFVPDYLTTYCKNFMMALPAQLFVAGPAARWSFRRIFRRNSN